MFHSSVRRAVSAAPQSPNISSLGASVPRTSTYVVSRRSRHQRRHSSSKPSSPDNGPKGLSAGEAVTATPQASSVEAKTEGEKRKRKAKDRQTSAKKLPSVPSTQHLSSDGSYASTLSKACSRANESADLSLTTFFSLHRPISVTHSLPKSISEDTFASIFTPKSTAQKRSEVMSTLSKTVQELEDPMTKLSFGTQEDVNTDNVTKVELRHADGSESSVYVQINAMNGNYSPFRPPPPPNTNAETSITNANDSAAVKEAPQHRVYKAVFTLEETTDQDGQIKVFAHTPQLIEEPAKPRRFLERMALRQLQYDTRSADGEQAVIVDEHGDTVDVGMDQIGYMAISVRRQRKLKMKKHKYKKLMRRTRVLRRKLDRN
jgi:hypothetical protein